MHGETQFRFSDFIAWAHIWDLIIFTGNDAIHALTKDGKQMLRIDLQKFSREKAHAMYSSFYVESEANKYRLKLGTFNGTKGLGTYLSFVL